MKFGTRSADVARREKPEKQMTTEEMRLLEVLAQEVRGVREDLKERDKRCMVRGETIAVLSSRQDTIVKQLNDKRRVTTSFVLTLLSQIIAAVGAAVLAVYIVT